MTSIISNREILSMVKREIKSLDKDFTFFTTNDRIMKLFPEVFANRVSILDIFINTFKNNNINLTFLNNESPTVISYEIGKLIGNDKFCRIFYASTWPDHLLQAYSKISDFPIKFVKKFLQRLFLNKLINYYSKGIIEKYSEIDKSKRILLCSGPSQSSY